MRGLTPAAFIMQSRGAPGAINSKEALGHVFKDSAQCGSIGSAKR
jgi:hypothetical protein